MRYQVQGLVRGGRFAEAHDPRGSAPGSCFDRSAHGPCDELRERRRSKRRPRHEWPAVTPLRIARTRGARCVCPRQLLACPDFPALPAFPPRSSLRVPERGGGNAAATATTGRVTRMQKGSASQRFATAPHGAAVSPTTVRRN